MAINRLYTFVTGDPILASEVNGELDQIIAELNSKPEANTVVQTDLNADLLDGHDSSLNGGDDTIPVCKAANVQVALNADLLDGLHASDIGQTAFASGTGLVFYQAAAPSGWTKVTGFSFEYVMTFFDTGTGGTKTGLTSDWGVTGISGTTDGHALTVSEMPAHTHTLGQHWTAFDEATKTVGQHDFVDAQSGVEVNRISGSTGSGSAHTHTFSGAAGATSWRPPRAYCIPCTKD